MINYLKRNQGLIFLLASFFFFFASASLYSQKNNTRPSVEGPDGYKVSSFSGSLFQERQDFFIESVGPDLDFNFTYTSNNREKNYGYGYGWRLKMHKTYIRIEDQIRIIGTDGGTKTFSKANGVWGAAPGIFDRLEEFEPDKFKLTSREGTVCFFDNPTHRQVTSIEDRCNNRMAFTYADTLLTQITDHTNRSIDLEWTDGLLTKLSHNLLAEERAYQYTYDGDQRLTQVVNPMGFVVEYSYDEGNRLVRVINENGVPTLVSYHRSGGVKKLTSCDFAMSFTYNQVQNETYVLEEVNGERVVTTYAFDEGGRNVKKDGSCCGLNIAYVYDEQNNIKKRTDGNQNSRIYTYDQEGNPTRIVDAKGQAESYEYSEYSLVTKYTDKLANEMVYQYDAKGNLLREVDALGGEKTYTYNAIGKVASYVNRLGFETSFTYNSHGYLSAVTHPDSTSNSSVFDPVGNLLSETDENGGVTQYVYDDLNRLVETVNPLGFSSSILYDAVGNPVEYTDERGNIAMKEYDGLNQVVLSVNPLGGETQYVYDPKGNITEETDAFGNKYEYAYDDKGNLVQVKNPDGGVVNIGYDAVGNKIAYTDAVGNETLYFYDENNDLIREVDALQNQKIYRYDRNRRLIEEVDFLGFSTRYEYDELGRLVKKIDHNNNYITNFYNAAGERIERVDKNGNSYKYEYDNRGRLVKILFPLGGQTTYAYDAVGNILRESHAQGHQILREYDTNNKLIRITNPIGLVSRYEYDSTGNRSAAYLPNGNVVRNQYNANNQLTEQTDNEGLVVQQRYDVGGRIISTTSADSITTTLTYDAMNMVTRKTYPDGTFEGFEYDYNSLLSGKRDRFNEEITIARNPINQVQTVNGPNGITTNFDFDANGNLMAMTDAEDNASQFTYDEIGRHTKTVQPNGDFVEYTYDANGNIVEKNISNEATVSYSYDAQDRLVRKTFPNGEECVFTFDERDRIISATSAINTVLLEYDELNRLTSESSNGGVVNYSYNLPGRERQINYPSGLMVKEDLDYRGSVSKVFADGQLLAEMNYLGGKLSKVGRSNGVETEYDYNQNGDIARILETVIGNDLNYTYDVGGYSHRVSNEANAEERSEYEYDESGRLVYAVSPNLTATGFVRDTALFSYDKLGNRVSYRNSQGTGRTYSTNVANQYSRVESSGSSVDLNYSSAGNLIALGGANYVYDFENRLIGIDNDISYAYDAFGRRTEKSVAGETTKYYYYKDRVIEEVRSTGETLKYVHGDGNQPIALFSDSLYYFHQDDRKSVVALTNDQGDLVERYDYSPYGELFVFSPTNGELPASQKGNGLFYTASQYDVESGLYYLRARHYSPRLGRFLQRDPISFRDGANLYQYARSNPINYVDPSGLKSCIKLGTGRGGQDPLGFLRRGPVSILKRIFAERERSVNGQWDVDGQICKECCEETKSYGPKLDLNLSVGISYNLSLNALPAIRMHPIGRAILGTAVIVGGFRTKDLFGGLKGSVGLSGSAGVSRSACGEWSGGGCVKFDAGASIEVSGEKDIDEPRFFGLIKDDVSLGVSLSAFYEVQACVKCTTRSCKWECEQSYGAKFNAWLDIEVSYWGNEFIEKASYEKVLASGGGPFQCPSGLPNLNR